MEKRVRVLGRLNVNMTESSSSEAKGLMGTGVYSIDRRPGEGAELVCIGVGEGAKSRLYWDWLRLVIEVSISVTNMLAWLRS